MRKRRADAAEPKPWMRGGRSQRIRTVWQYLKTAPYGSKLRFGWTEDRHTSKKKSLNTAVAPQKSNPIDCECEGRFVRCCDAHQDRLLLKDDQVCAAGHRVRKWVVIDTMTGEVVGSGALWDPTGFGSNFKVHANTGRAYRRS